MAQDEDAVVEVVDEMVPGDEAPPGTPGTGEDVCPTCNRMPAYRFGGAGR